MSLSQQERDIKKQILIIRSEIQRQQLAQSINDIQDQLTPQHLLSKLLDRFRSKPDTSESYPVVWTQLPSLILQNPGLSLSLLGGVRTLFGLKSSRFLRWASASLVAYKVYKQLKKDR